MPNPNISETKSTAGFDAKRRQNPNAKTNHPFELFCAYNRQIRQRAGITYATVTSTQTLFNSTRGDGEKPKITGNSEGDAEEK